MIAVMGGAVGRHDIINLQQPLQRTDDAVDKSAAPEKNRNVPNAPYVDGRGVVAAEDDFGSAIPQRHHLQMNAHTCARSKMN